MEGSRAMTEPEKSAQFGEEYDVGEGCGEIK